MSSLGFSGSLAARFQNNEITPLLALVGLLLGLFAVLITPREEEPQIEVTFANVFIAMPGASAREVENLIAFPAEQKLDEIEGVEHVYSVSMPGQVVLTVQFEVGEKRRDVIVRLYNEIFSNLDWLPAGMGVTQPLIRPMGIDDVPIVTATLWTENPEMSAHDLLNVAHAVEAEIKRIPDTRDVYTIGGPDHVVSVELDSQKLMGFGLSLEDIRNALMASNIASHGGALVQDNREIPVQAGTLLASAEEVRELVVAVYDGRPVYLEDVANVQRRPDHPQQYVWMHAGKAWKGDKVPVNAPAVTLAIAKKPGSNAVDIAHMAVERLDSLKGSYIPDHVQVDITRNYGETADSKARKLIQKLVFATLSVVLLVYFALGWREAIVVGAAVIITLAITLFASWAWGFTLNRVSLFALIFSIGILVDDAVVVVENIHRHMAMGKKSLLDSIPLAVDEVGGPTILATFTVIAALLPMAFVSGLMGPYMSPIPINASIGMLISLIIALVVTPWLSLKLLGGSKVHAEEESGLLAFFRKIMMPFLGGEKGRKSRWMLAGGIVLLLGISLAMVSWQWVILKMLPFDNKSEIQVVVEMPEGSALELTNTVLVEMAGELEKIDEVEHLQAYAGTASPIDFNGLVRQYYLRQQANMGDIKISLVDKKHRDRQSHEIALSIRPAMTEIANRYGAVAKIVEVPPGPPVLSPVVAEVYGPDYEGRQELAAALLNDFRNTSGIVDSDALQEEKAVRKILVVDRQKAAMLGVSQASVANAVKAALSGLDASYLHEPSNKYPLPVRLELPGWQQGEMAALLSLPVRSMNGELVRLSELVSVQDAEWESRIYHKDLKPVVFVTADVAGKVDSPLYGMFELVGNIADRGLNGQELEQYFIKQPDSPYAYGLKWDGEWQITYETFRDMGIAYSVGLILIYLLVVAQFRSYLVPLIIMVPIPLTVIGVMPGHALWGANFTATSMIGMIALAGIIVRNSILLVDFINQETEKGMNLQDAVIEAAAVRAKPIALTALAAMMGAFFILDDPIFNGLAVSLIFGILVSTLLTLVVIPVLYYSFRMYQTRNRQEVG